MKQNRWRPGLVLLIVLVVVPLAGWLIWNNLGQTRGVALGHIVGQTPAPLAGLAELISGAYHEYRANAVRWSFVYFGCLFGSAFLSALAGVILKLESFGRNEKRQRDLAALSAALAALLITLTSIGAFEQKWRANRHAADALEALSFELLKPDAQGRQARILADVQRIITERGNQVLTVAAPATPAQPAAD